MAKPLLQAEALAVHFPIAQGLVRAVDGVDLTVHPGETLGLVGESGCGKSTLGRALVGLRPLTAGRVYFDGRDLSSLAPDQRRALFREMQFIFQDPFSSLNPRMTIGTALERPLIVHGLARGAARAARVRELLEAVGLSATAAERYPHEFSGGQRQRIGIARALAVQPRLVVADEPTSALDVSIQSQILNLLGEIKQQFGLTLIFISHDLGVIKLMSDRVAVMYLGNIVETAPSEQLFASPQHPYTRALLSAASVMNPAQRRERIRLHGAVPSAINPPGGCRLHPRCPWAMEQCATVAPLLRPLAPDHLVACHLYDATTAATPSLRK